MGRLNYYKHHIGDYATHTEHLTWDEDMAYSRLIRVYYRDERPLPADVGKVCRLVRASTETQKEAVQTVLDEYFVLGEDGWRSKRCDEEIQKAQEKAEHNREVGKQGGRPRKEETQMVSENNPDGFQDSEERKPNGTLSTTPLATSHKPSLRSGRRASRRCPADFFPTPEAALAIGAECPDVDLRAETKRFMDHEFQKSKSDWLATWRNWMREAQSRIALAKQKSAGKRSAAQLLSDYCAPAAFGETNALEAIPAK